MDIKKELAKYHLTEDWYEKLLKDCSDKLERVSDMDWGEINDKYNLGWNPDTLRKSFNTTLLGGGFVKQYMEEKYAANQSIISEDEYLEKLRIEKEEYVSNLLIEIFASVKKETKDKYYTFSERNDLFQRVYWLIHHSMRLTNNRFEGEFEMGEKQGPAVW